MQNRVRELLREMADEVPTYHDVPPSLERRARRQVALRVGTTGLVAFGLVLATVAGLRSLSSDRTDVPGVDISRPSDSPSPSVSAPTTTRGTVRFGGSGCAYKGPTTAPAGQIRIHVVNRVEERLYFALLSIGQGHTYDDLTRWTTGPQSELPPGWVTVVGDADVAASEGRSSGQLTFTTDVEPGLYGIVCATPTVPASRIWTPGSFSVATNT